MSKTRRVVLTLAVLALGTALLAACGPEGNGVAAVGTLKAVDATEATVTVTTSDGADLVLKLTANTRILAGGEPATVEQLTGKIGSEVNVRYIAETNALEAISF